MLALTALCGACGVNNIPTLDAAVNDAWNEVQTHYQRRSDLVPQVITLLQASGNPADPELLSELSEALLRVASMDISPSTLNDETDLKIFEARQDDLAATLGRVTSTSEMARTLRFDQSFLGVQEELNSIARNIHVARLNYVEAVRRYNTELRTVPGRWWHRFMYPEMQRKELFSIPDSGSVTGE